MSDTSHDASLLIASSFRVRPGARGDFLERAAELARGSRAEPGCLEFRLFADPDSEDGFFFYHHWRDRDALRRHTGTTHLQAFIAAFPGLLDGEPDLKIHEVAATRRAGLDAFSAGRGSAP